MNAMKDAADAPTQTRKLSLAELLARSMEDDDPTQHDARLDTERWDDDEGSSGG